MHAAQRLAPALARAFAAALLLLALRPSSAPALDVLLDDFEQLEGWSVVTSDVATLTISPEAGRTGNAMRLDFDFHGAGGYVNVQKVFSLPLPENYSFSFFVRGEAPPNNFEFKLIDPSGRNVWWRNQRNLSFSRDWEKMLIRKSRIEFAWGPSDGALLNHVSAIEFTIAAGTGGKGTVWIDDLGFEEREAADGGGRQPLASSSTALVGHDAALALDNDPATSWHSEPADEQWLLIDFEKAREFGGLVIDWDGADYARQYRVDLSDDGNEWRVAHTRTVGHGGRDYLYMPDAESRYVRIELQRSSRGLGYGIGSIQVQPFEFSASPDQFFRAIAADAPPGSFPKYLSGKQTYWTVIGVDGDPKEALLNEEGMLEVDQGMFSLEPFLLTGGDFLSWSTAETTQQLQDGYLPIPSVTRRHEALHLEITGLADGPLDVSTLHARYRVRNDGDQPVHASLFVAIRPFQVNPPWQSLNFGGGMAPIRQLRLDGRTAWVNGEKAVVSVTPPDGFGAAAFEQGDVTEFLRRNELPPGSEVVDPFGYASGAFRYLLDLPPGASRDVVVRVPFHYPNIIAEAASQVADAGADFDERLEKARADWAGTLDRVDIQLPGDHQEIVRTLKTALAHILINRDGPAIQPGSRTYARSWMRDGALTSVALLQMGFTEEARDFIRWFAAYQYPSGKIPCCVDARGADPTPEHDSGGEFIFAVAEYYRYTRDVGFLAQMWPHVVKAVEYLDSLRQQRMTDEYKDGDKQLYFGLLPESISHEGYAAHPVHSYWDDFFALLGFKDAARLSVVMDENGGAGRFATLRDAFRNDLNASIARSMAKHGIDYIPGSADLGDFDPTSTAIALVPVGEVEHLPGPALTRTFDKYFTYFTDRKEGKIDWQAYTPYEFRNAGALLRLGQQERAFEVFRFLLADRRPADWHQWTEIVWRDPSAPKFIGDMPHTWVASGFILAFRSMLAYERVPDEALVIGAGIPSEWVTDGDGVVVRRLPTHYGPLNYTLRPDGPDTLRLRVSGDLNLPPGNIVIRSPLDRPLAAVEVNGAAIQAFDARQAVVGVFPAEVALHYAPRARAGEAAAPAPPTTPSPNVRSGAGTPPQ